MKLEVEQIAKIAHQANKAYCESIGDLSQVDWDSAPEWQRSSAVTGVQFIRDNPCAHPGEVHESWLRQKFSDGWTYGPVKDPEKKEHPCCVEYAALPTEQIAKDHLFKAVAKSLLQFSQA